MTPQEIASRIRRARDEANETQREFAAALGVSHGWVAKWELGLALPSLALRRKIAALYRILPAELGLSKSEPGVVLHPKERRLLQTFRTLPASVQDNILDITTIAREAVTRRSQQSQPSQAESIDCN